MNNIFQKCEVGWVYFKHSCFKTSLSPLPKMLPWDQALDACQGEGGLLAVITNAKQEAFIVNLKNSVASGIGPYFLQLFYWIGLVTDGQHNTSSWVNGAALSYSNIKMVDGQSGLCYGIKGGAWVAAPCNSSFPYICEKGFN